MKKPTIKQLIRDRTFDASRIAALHAEIERLKNERFEVELKGHVVEAAAHLVEGLCKMIGGPGYR